jgi:prepilin peptidase CpaA
MNLALISPWWLTAVMVSALIAAAVEDAVRFRISNIICAAVFAAALVAMGLHGFSWSLWQNALVSFTILAVGTVAFAMKWLGGGDVKLLASIGLWIDLSSAAGLIAAVFVAGGLVAILYIGARRLFHDTKLSAARQAKIPYGLAVVAGALFIFTTQLSDRAGRSVQGGGIKIAGIAPTVLPLSR